VEVLRDGESRTLYVVTAELPEQEAVAEAAVEEPDTAEANKLGLAVTDLTPEQREQLESKDHGVLVTDVGDGPARSAGIRKGDVILMLNGVKVENSAEFQSLAADLPAGKAVSILVQRQGNPIFLALKTEE
jgi:serine protease Do